jgi:hypothetical protein
VSLQHKASLLLPVGGVFLQAGGGYKGDFVGVDDEALMQEWKPYLILTVKRQ